MDNKTISLLFNENASKNFKAYYEQNADYIIDVQEQTFFEKLKQLRIQNTAAAQLN